MSLITVPQSGFSTQTELAARYRLNPKTVAKQLERSQVQLYRSPYDLRVRLVRNEDAKRIFEDRPIQIQEDRHANA